MVLIIFGLSSSLHLCIHFLRTKSKEKKIKLFISSQSFLKTPTLTFHTLQQNPWKYFLFRGVFILTLLYSLKLSLNGIHWKELRVEWTLTIFILSCIHWKGTYTEFVSSIQHLAYLFQRYKASFFFIIFIE